jgi:peptidyl-prolyl cis-trans isomerase D
MLQAIRNRAQGVLAWIVLILITIPFALWGIQNYLDVDKEQPVAVVGDREIFERDVNRVYEQSLAGLVGIKQVDDKELRQEALNRLIREQLVAEEIVEKDLVVSDADVRALIQSLPYFQTDGKFDKQKYELTLSSQNLSSTQFTAQVRQALAAEQYQKSIADTALVTTQQLERFSRLRNQEREIEYVTIPLRDSDQEISDNAINDYYQNNRPLFRSPERISIQYLHLRLEDVAKGIHASESDLRSLYEEQKQHYTTEERRRISHILVVVPPNADEGAMRTAFEKAGQIRERIEKGEDFAGLAKEASDDKVSAEKGGDLGFLIKGTMDKEFEDAAYRLANGAVSEPVKTAFGYHLINLTEIIPGAIKPYEAVRDELLKTYQRNAAENAFYELGQSLSELSFEHPDTLEPAAQKLNLKIEETGLFTRDSSDGIAANQAVREAAFSEEVLNGKNSEPIEVPGDKIVVLRVKEHQPATDLPLEAVKPEIIKSLRLQLAKEETRRRAEGLRKQVQQGTPLAQLAKAETLSLNKPKAFRRDSSEVSMPIVEAAFKAAKPQPGRSTPTVIEMENGEQVLVNLLAVNDENPQNIDAKELESARVFLARSTGQADLAAFLSQLREEGDIEIKTPTGKE